MESILPDTKQTDEVDNSRYLILSTTCLPATYPKYFQCCMINVTEKMHTQATEVNKLSETLHTAPRVLPFSQPAWF